MSDQMSGAGVALAYPRTSASATSGTPAAVMPPGWSEMWKPEAYPSLAQPTSFWSFDGVCLLWMTAEVCLL